MGFSIHVYIEMIEIIRETRILFYSTFWNICCNILVSYVIASGNIDCNIQCKTSRCAIRYSGQKSLRYDCSFRNIKKISPIWQNKGHIYADKWDIAYVCGAAVDKKTIDNTNIQQDNSLDNTKQFNKYFYCNAHIFNTSSALPSISLRHIIWDYVVDIRL